MSRTFFISDTHFHHKSVLTYQPIRIKKLVQYYQSSGKFGTISAEDIEKRIYEMMTTDEGYNEVICDHDKMLIKEWNSVVKPSDTVWFLGDFKDAPVTDQSGTSASCITLDDWIFLLACGSSPPTAAAC